MKGGKWTMSQDSNNEAYAKGDEDGKNGFFLDDIAQSLSSGINFSDEEVCYNKGYDHGRNDRGREDSSDTSDKPCGCYITTACLEARGIPVKDSLEYRTIKDLTKNHILASFSGKRDYVKYNKIGPGIVEAVNARSDSQEIWGGVYSDLQNVSGLVLQGMYEAGHQAYKRMVGSLQEKVLA